jgi:hypothetical protein
MSGESVHITRRTCLAALTAAVAAERLIGKENGSMKEFLESIQNEKKSVTLHVKGQTIGGGIVKVSGDVIELRNREFSRIVVRIDSIDAAAIN